MAQPAIVLQLEELIRSRTTVSQGPSGTSTPQDAAISEVSAFTHRVKIYS